MLSAATTVVVAVTAHARMTATEAAVAELKRHGVFDSPCRSFLLIKSLASVAYLIKINYVIPLTNRVKAV